MKDEEAFRVAVTNLDQMFRLLAAAAVGTVKAIQATGVKKLEESNMDKVRAMYVRQILLGEVYTARGTHFMVVSQFWAFDATGELVQASELCSLQGERVQIENDTLAASTEYHFQGLPVCVEWTRNAADVIAFRIGEGSATKIIRHKTTQKGAKEMTVDERRVQAFLSLVRP